MSEELRKAELDLFPTPVSVYDLEYYDFKPLIKIIEETERTQFHLVSGGESTFSPVADLLGHPNLVDLRSELMKCVNDYCHRLGTHPVDIVESWFNITPPGGRLELHRHEGSAISGALYPCLNGQDVAPLLFKSPLLPYKMNELYRPGAESQHAFGFNTVWPSQGLLILFPSWLEHKTDTEIGNRTVVSFNTSYAPETNDSK